MAGQYLETYFTPDLLAAREQYELAEQLAPAPDLRQKVERLFLINVISFDWNRPQHITPRYNEKEVREIVAPLRQRIAEREARRKN